MPIRINTIGTLTEADVIAAYGYAYDQRYDYNDSGGAKGAFIVATNSSFGVNGGSPGVYSVWCDMYDTMGSVGILSCGATANLNVNVESFGDMPTRCTSDYFIGVTSSDITDGKPTNVAYGTTSIDIAAPGGDLSDGIISSQDGNTYGTDNGTSYATPHVTGTISLMYASACEDLLTLYQTHPAEIALIVKDYLLEGADQVSSFSSYVAGSRRLNALGALDNIAGLGNPSVGSVLEINSNTTWDNTEFVSGDILVKSGYSFTIEDIVYMPVNGKITVEKGAELTIDGGKITTSSPNCAGYWKGIEVLGDKTKTQTTANQGVIILQNNAVIKYANEAIYTGEFGITYQGGAIIEAVNSTFRNNRRCVAFLEYDIADNISYFDNCQFILNQDYEQSDFIDMFTAWDVYGVEITNCTFSNTSSVSDKNHAIYTIDAGYSVLNNCSFEGFDYGVYGTNSNTTNVFVVDEASFDYNALCVYAGAVDDIVVTSNTMIIGNHETTFYNHGVFIDESKGFQIENNTLTGNDVIAGSPRPYGIE